MIRWQKDEWYQRQQSLKKEEKKNYAEQATAAAASANEKKNSISNRCDNIRRTEIYLLLNIN